MRVGLLSLAPVDAIILVSRVKEIGCFTLSASFRKSMRSENWFSILLREAMSPR